MHNIYNPDNWVDRNIVESEELLGRECATCLRILPSRKFNRDSSTRDGLRVRCQECESTPALSIAENTAMMKERNYNSDALQKLRPAYMDSLKCDLARIGRPMPAGEFLHNLKKLIPDLIWIPGKIADDIAVYIVDRRADLGYRYLWYIENDMLPEFSLWEFDERDFPVKEKKRGWRTPLLRCVLADLITEKQADEVFGRPPENLASEVWYRRLYAKRNNLGTDA